MGPNRDTPRETPLPRGHEARNLRPSHSSWPEQDYLISTVAPTSSNFFFMAAASSFESPSLTTLGAPSTRSLASFRPRFVTSRTTLMTLIFLSPAPVRWTANSVFSSSAAGAPAAAPPPVRRSYAPEDANTVVPAEQPQVRPVTPPLLPAVPLPQDQQQSDEPGAPVRMPSAAAT